MIYYLDAYKFCPLCSARLNRKKKFIECSVCEHRIFANPKTAVNVIIESRGKILLAKRKYRPFAGWWDLPGGFIEDGENLVEAAKREVKEELGLTIQPTKLIGCYPANYEYRHLIYKLIVIVLAARTELGKIVAGDDVADFSFVHRSQVLEKRICQPQVNKAALKEYFLLFP